MSWKVFLQGYLVAYLFWLGLSLGCLAILMIHHLAGGRWGFVVRRVLEAGSRTLPLMAVLFVPVLLGVPELYPWTSPGIDPVLLHKQGYLNLPFFVVRAVVYLAVWLGLVWWLDRAAERQEHGQPSKVRLASISALGLILYGVTVSFAGIDWIMSLEPHWFSSIFGVLLAAGQLLNGFAFAILVLVLLRHRPPLAERLRPQQFHDLGNFLLSFVVFWAYIGFSQYLIIWMGNLPEEITWYVHRVQNGWGGLALALIIGHFFVPFLLLLSRDLKRHPTTLAAIAAAVWLMGVAVVAWLVLPAFGRGWHWIDPLLLILVGILWLLVFRQRLGQRPLLPKFDARVPEAHP